MKSRLINTDAQTGGRVHTHTHTHALESGHLILMEPHTRMNTHTYRCTQNEDLRGSGLVCHLGAPLNNDRLIIRGEHTH